jgi:hypothetical protein
MQQRSHQTLISRTGAFEAAAFFAAFGAEARAPAASGVFPGVAFFRVFFEIVVVTYRASARVPAARSPF